MKFSDYFNMVWSDKDTECMLCDKARRVRDLVTYMLDRTNQIFVWEGLPDTIPAYQLELMFQTFGNVCITEVPSNGRYSSGLYAFYGGLGGEPDPYYQPTIYTVSNPAMNFNRELTIGDDCVRARNDVMGIGLLPTYIKYATMLNENEISMNMLSILYRIDQLVSADNDRTYESAKEYFNSIVAGKFGVISSSEFFEGIQTSKNTSGKSIKDLIEYEQYIKASWYNEIGLNSNYNMKRERIVSSEAQMNDDSLIPLVENMLSCRIRAIDDIKKLYGDKYDLSGLSVALNSIWDLDNMFTSIPESGVEQDPEQEPEQEPEQDPEQEPEQDPEQEPEQEDITIDVNINVTGEEEDDEEKEAD